MISIEKEQLVSEKTSQDVPSVNQIDSQQEQLDALFQEVTVRHSTPNKGTTSYGRCSISESNRFTERNIENLDKRATEQYLKTHDRLPTLEEIDAVIKEYRNGR